MKNFIGIRGTDSSDMATVTQFFQLVANGRKNKYSLWGNTELNFEQDKPFSLDELKEAVLHLHAGSSKGPKGIPIYCQHN